MNDESTPSSFIETTRMGDAVLIICGVDIPIEFRVDFEHLRPGGKYDFTGHITHAQITSELVSLWKRSHLQNPDMRSAAIFAVSGDMNNCNARLTCNNCYFIPYGDLPEMSDEMVPCDLLFKVINPNDDICMEWIS